MSVIIQLLGRPVIFAMLYNAFTLSYGQVNLADKDGITTINTTMMPQVFTEVNQSIQLEFSRKLLVDVWTGSRKIENGLGYFGLRFVPTKDQNVYLLYNFELNETKSKAQIGLSLKTVIDQFREQVQNIE